MLTRVSPQDGPVGPEYGGYQPPYSHTVLSLQEVQSGQEDASVPREGSQIPQGWFTAPHSGKPQGTKGLLKRPLMQHGEEGEEARACKSWRQRARWAGRGPGKPAVSPEPTPQPCAACSLHSQGGAASRPPSPFLQHVPLPSPKSELKKKKKESLGQNL